MTATGSSKSGGTAPAPTVEASALSPLTEAWIERMMRAGERMHRDGDFRQEIAGRLS